MKKSIMRSGNWHFFFLVGAFSAGLALAAGDPAGDPDRGVVAQIKENGPHGGNVLETNSNRVEVVIDHKNERVDVFVLHKPKEKIQGLSVTLLTDAKHQSVVALQKLEPAEDMPHYQGGLAPEVKSVVGIELRFDLPRGKRMLIRSPHGTFMKAGND